MKKNIVILLILSIIVSFAYEIIGKRTVSANLSSDIDVIMDKIKRTNGKVTGWSLYTRESINVSSENDWIHQVDLLKMRFSNMSWNVEKEKNRLVAVGYIKRKDYVESIKFLSTPTNDLYSSYLIYELKGTHWNKQMAQNLKEKIDGKLDVLYSEKPVIFSCIKGEFSDKIDKVLSSEVSQILTSLNANEKEALKEKDFYSISAYSPKLMESIPTKDNQMNLQIGLRKTGMGANTSFVIGTPIITIEY
ncbi:membrane protein [Heyndrickxia sporothermodurans]|nr:membrane protein [Heyndrickxia sporothermodurans]